MIILSDYVPYNHRSKSITVGLVKKESNIRKEKLFSPFFVLLF